MATITAELSALARVSLNAAYDFALKGLKAKYGEPISINADGVKEEALLSIIALGKLGGGELNFLSDIDILYICSTNGGETSGFDYRLSYVAQSGKHTNVSSALNQDVKATMMDFELGFSMPAKMNSSEAAYRLKSAPKDSPDSVAKPIPNKPIRAA